MTVGALAAARGGDQVADRVAAVGAAGRRGAEVAGVQGGGVDEHGEGRGVGVALVLIHPPLLLRAVDQAQVVDAGVLAAGRTSLEEARDGDSGEQADDGYDDHDFDEGEVLAFHGHFLLVCLFF